jgi:hypothetical protein
MFEKNYEMRKKFQETWAIKIPWAKLVAYTCERKEKLFAFK